MANLKQFKKGIPVKVSEHFMSTEFDSKGGYPDEEYTLIDLDHVSNLEKLRAKMGTSCQINSGYRSPTHNKAEGGATLSRHVAGDATDVVFKGKTPEEVAKAAEELGFGGIGIYDTFTHVDSRPGKKARWDFRTKK